MLGLFVYFFLCWLNGIAWALVANYYHLLTVVVMVGILITSFMLYTLAWDHLTGDK